MSAARTRRTGALLAALALAGCGAVSDEGATDFRRALPEGAGSAWVKLQPAGAADSPIGAGEVVQITLATAFVADFWSLLGHPAVSGGKPNGEIAIVVSAFEDDGRTPDRFGTDALANARVVYFNEDVVEGQFLNFGPGLPVYGPAVHRGFPLRLDLWIVELDQPGDQARRLLSVLAALGGTAYPPSAPIAGPLARLAGTLITDRQDDPAFHYTLTLGGGGDGVAGVPLVPGDIVLVRQKQRDRDTDWTGLRFHAPSGRLARDRPECAAAELPAGCTFREQTHLVLQVSRAARPLDAPRVPLAFDELRRQLAGQSPPAVLGEAGLQEAEAAFAALGAALAAQDRADALRAPLAELAGRSGCGPDGEPGAERRRAAEAFVAGWLAPTSGTGAVPALPADERERLLARAGDRIGRTVTDQARFDALMAALRAGSADAATRTKLTTALAACPPARPAPPA